ncbi:hypothetical protein NDN08_006271 [Rhodosorus marinus]|uniref:Uncharacterized protein n=1 Tax=Rhodosorus marinus TaxID=101924 RepID=A0AAV8UKM8_9RHOD|nr:hypothetical protein NDN08_006271 [Rhodosorus marinus]
MIASYLLCQWFGREQGDVEKLWQYHSLMARRVSTVRSPSSIRSNERFTSCGRRKTASICCCSSRGPLDSILRPVGSDVVARTYKVSRATVRGPLMDHQNGLVFVNLLLLL